MIPEKLHNVKVAQQKRGDLKDAFNKQLILADTAILSVLVSLHKSPVQTDCSRISFSATILLLGVSLPLLAGGLYGHISLYNKLVKFHAEELADALFPTGAGSTPKLQVLYPDKIYRFSEAAGYISFVLAIISLTIYGLLIA